jgi:hypothetical protein
VAAARSCCGGRVEICGPCRRIFGTALSPYLGRRELSDTACSGR